MVIKFPRSEQDGRESVQLSATKPTPPTLRDGTFSPLLLIPFLLQFSEDRVGRRWWSVLLYQVQSMKQSYSLLVCRARVVLVRVNVSHRVYNAGFLYLSPVAVLS